MDDWWNQKELRKEFLKKYNKKLKRIPTKENT